MGPAIAVAGCGGGAHFANRPRPPSPVDLTVYVNDQRVLVSPGSIGGGPVQFFVTNQASRSVSLEVETPGGEQIAETGPINPGLTAQVAVDPPRSGDYTIATSSSIRSATLHVGAPRPSADNQLLQP